MNMEARKDVIEEKSKSLSFRVLLSRRDLGWDQETLAQKAGISRGYISKLERGYTKNPGIEIIKSLADALNVSTQYLLGATDDPLSGLKEDEDVNVEEQHRESLLLEKISDSARRLLIAFTELSPRDQSLLLGMAESMRQTNIPHIIGEDSAPDEGDD